MPNKTFVRRFKEYCSRNVSVFISLGSLCVAVVALITGILSQATDRRYKEASILPAVQQTVSSGNYGSWWVNNGLGPARITRIEISTETECIDSGRMTYREWNETSNAFMIAMSNQIFNELPFGNRRWSVTTGLPSVNTLLRPGDRWTLIELEESEKPLMRSTEISIDPKVQEQAMLNFVTHLLNVPIRLQYTSATGESGFTLIPRDGNSVMKNCR